MTKSSWFASWFDSKYYHLLYKDRDEQEAFEFIDRLIDELGIPLGKVVLDLACGKGRHARRMAEKGLMVIGIDLSENNIESAKEFQSDNLKFEVHDMRQVFMPGHFDYIFNFFTSFGYFENEEDNLSTLRSVATGLKSGGEFVIDFLNAPKVIRELVANEEKNIDGNHFSITRHFDGKRIIKKISLDTPEGKLSYEEIVQALRLEDFEAYFNACNLKTHCTYGNYMLEPYDPANSERLIIRAVKL